jgi:hypothetical protein
MSERSSKAPDERFETVSKGHTRDTLAGVDKNRQKPDDVRVKGETHQHHVEQEEEESEEEEEE